ncbi:unnamed protein product [Staurois parvus]|uniref:Uncharacterized protein n=1 Tax=Staurois parvus TaxID=386267 RepID=A0ABN9GCI5_9NEOB|nr:unnamed protein product [Staurois parvus]
MTHPSSTAQPGAALTIWKLGHCPRTRGSGMPLVPFS